MKRVNARALILSLLVVYLVAFVGSLFSSNSVNSAWYDSIKPAITPPNWVFPVVWNILFLLIGISLYFLWTAKFRNNKETKKKRKIVALVFGINLALNILWSLFFFTLKSPLLSFFEIIILWVSILAIMIFAWKIRRLSAYLLVPYALWVAFAGILNYMIAFR
ncbi:MAG: tryptophan-rich sensory protein [Candidatus Pacearchaeota archaeon]|nr:tryptophan-rich sensory protein [Candidatus Pacearchaeota archaeon]